VRVTDDRAAGIAWRTNRFAHSDRRVRREYCAVTSTSIARRKLGIVEAPRSSEKAARLRLARLRPSRPEKVLAAGSARRIADRDREGVP